MPRPLRVLRSSDLSHVSCYPLSSLEKALIDAGAQPISLVQDRSEILFTKVLSKLRLVRNFYRNGSGPVFVACMGFQESKTIPFSYWTEIIPYCFDCWPSTYPRWKSFFKRHRIRTAFFSARQSAVYFQKIIPQLNCVWVAEATDPSEYAGSKPLKDRTIDLLELGRKYDQFHNSVSGMQVRGRVHLFEKTRGEIIFPTKTDLVRGLGDSKISVCFPSSLTHPERSGDVETVTHRYFESIASRCVLLGKCPSELKDIFGHNPVIEVQCGRENQQIESILSNLAFYQEMVDKNYERLLQVGTWASRAQQLLSYI